MEISIDRVDPAWMRRISRTWLPLAASWLLMGIEVPAISATIARLDNPNINLAAYGGIVYPISLVIEAPIIMLLAASVALCKDWASYRRVYRFMMVLSAILTIVHFLVAFTPLYYVVTVKIMGVPPAILEPGQVGLQIMLPWTWAIAYRRFQQGVMIRFGHSQAVGVGTLVRLSADALVLGGGYLLGLPGIVVGAGAQAVSVVCEAIYAGLRVRPILANQLRPAPAVPLISWREFYRFYVPLALTQLLALIWQPIGSAAISRMPNPVQSLAVFPVVMGVISLLRFSGTAFNEVVVALLDEPGSSRPLHRFTMLLFGGITLVTLIWAATPLSAFWFSRVSALSPGLVSLAEVGFWLAAIVPGLTALQSWYQGAILHGRKTRGIPESIMAFFIVLLVVMSLGVARGGMQGIYVGLAAFAAGNVAQTAWLWLRSRPVMWAVNARDQQVA
jgi:hypothetical protein